MSSHDKKPHERLPRPHKIDTIGPMLKIVTSDDPDLSHTSAFPERKVLRDSEVDEALRQVHDQVLAGQIATFDHAKAVLELQGIAFDRKDLGFGYGDSNIDDALRDLRNLLEGVEQGFDPELVELRKIFRFVEQFPPNLGTLRYLQELEDKHRNSPAFPQIHKEIGALRLIKKNELIQYFIELLRELTETYDHRAALQFKHSFFGTEHMYGSGLVSEDLPLSPRERMVLNTIKMEKE